MQYIKSTLGLSLQIAKVEFKLRNEGTWLGIFWYLLNPLFTFLLMLGIFTNRLGNDIENYAMYLLIGILLFNFFQTVTTRAVSLIKAKAGIIKSLQFPREALILSVVIQTAFSHLFEIVVLVFLLLLTGTSITYMILYPLVLLFLILFSYGAGLILASLSVYFFDLDNIWSFVSRLIWLGTPIFYSIGGQSKLLLVNMFNPMYFIITFAREIIVYQKIPSTLIIVGTIGYSIAAFIIGLLLFKKLKRKFAELI